MWVRHGISDRGGSGRSSLNLSEREKTEQLSTNVMHASLNDGSGHDYVSCPGLMILLGVLGGIISEGAYHRKKCVSKYLLQLLVFKLKASKRRN